jgi:hypothetical protein
MPRKIKKANKYMKFQNTRTGDIKASKPSLLIATIWICFPGAAFSANQISEEELLKLEYAKSAEVWSKDSRVLSEHSALTRFPVLAYAKALDAEESVIAEPTSQKTNLSSGVVAPATDIALAASALGGSQSTGGTIGNAATIVAVAGIGLNVLNAIFSSNENASSRRYSLWRMKSPSLYLVRSETDNKGETLETSHAKVTEIMRSIKPFDCDVTINRFGRDLVGAAHKDASYSRSIVCADDEARAKRAILVDRPVIESRVISSFRYNQEKETLPRSVSMIEFYSLDRMRYTNMLGIPEIDEEQQKHLGRLAYEKAKDFIPPEWTAVYTAPNPKGVWAVFVARNGVTIEFPMPKS